MKRIIGIVGFATVAGILILSGVFIPEDAKAAFCVSCFCEDTCKDIFPDFQHCSPTGCVIMESLSYLACYQDCTQDGGFPTV